MEYKVQITDEAGNVQQYAVSRSSSSEDKSLNDFILEALRISEDKRKLPLKTQCPNGLEVYPSIKMKFENTNKKMNKDFLNFFKPDVTGSSFHKCCYEERNLFFFSFFREGKI